MIRTECRCVCLQNVFFYTYTYFTCPFQFAQTNTHRRSYRCAATTAKYFLLHCVSAERCWCCTMPTSTVVVHVHVKCAPLVSFRSQCDFICFLLFRAAISVVSQHSIYGTLELPKTNEKQRKKIQNGGKNKNTKIVRECRSVLCDASSWRATRLLTCCNATKILYYCCLARALAHFYAIYVYPCASSLVSLLLCSAFVFALFFVRLLVLLCFSVLFYLLTRSSRIFLVCTQQRNKKERELTTTTATRKSKSTQSCLKRFIRAVRRPECVTQR